MNKKNRQSTGVELVFSFSKPYSSKLEIEIEAEDYYMILIEIHREQEKQAIDWRRIGF